MSASTVDTKPRRARFRSREARDARVGWAFVAPFALAFVLVFLIPIIVSIRQSFFRQLPSGGGAYGGGELLDTFVGWQNYAEVVGNERFWAGMGRVVLYACFQIPVMILLALGLALLIDSFIIKRVGVFRLGNFLPYAIPGIVAAMVWLYLYTPEISPIVKGLEALGMNVDFMSKNMMLLSMANMTTWTYTGYNMLIFLAALQAIPHDLYEAARIDGATGWQIVYKIKVPLVSGAALLAVLLSIIGTIQLFNEPAVMETANPWMGKDYTPMMMAYNTMMGTITPAGDGPASAISITMAVIAGALAVIYALLQGKVARSE
ncbi:sugar ABC transporter permease [Scrofimicrobium sp. R131]|uniref:Sugar ABC transporter permease n=1 Tax=Scrofimicrobium appendicitidis TaxID=3079930 RepID=A0AAU7V7G3_9ACTO